MIGIIIRPEQPLKFEKLQPSSLSIISEGPLEITKFQPSRLQKFSVMQSRSFFFFDTIGYIFSNICQYTYHLLANEEYQ